MSRHTTFNKPVRVQDSFASLSTEINNQIKALADNIQRQTELLEKQREALVAASVDERGAETVQITTESQPLISEKATLERDIKESQEKKEHFVKMLRSLNEMQQELLPSEELVISVGHSVNEENPFTSTEITKMQKFGDALNIMLNIAKLSGPALMVYAHKNDHPRSDILGPALMNGIIFSGAAGTLLPYISKYSNNLSPSTVALLKTLSSKLNERVAPILGIVTSFLMLGQMTMAPELNPFVITALIAFSLPAILHLTVGEEILSRFKPDPYFVSMKAVELFALGLFTFATSVGMKEDSYLKYQLAGVSVLLFDAGISFFKHAKNIVGACLEDRSKEENDFNSSPVV